MTDDTRIIWAYTERHLREWMQDMHEQYRDGDYFDFPDPASLTAEQIEDLYRRDQRHYGNQRWPHLGNAGFRLDDYDGSGADPRQAHTIN